MKDYLEENLKRAIEREKGVGKTIIDKELDKMHEIRILVYWKGQEPDESTYVGKGKKRIWSFLRKSWWK